MKGKYRYESRIHRRRFAKAVKNPFFEKRNKRIEIAVRHETYAVFEEIGRKNGVSAEFIMKRCLDSYAKKLQAHD